MFLTTFAHISEGKCPSSSGELKISRRMAWLDRWGTPAYLAFHAIIIWSTLFGRTITWAGRTYQLDASNRVTHIVVT